MNLKIEQTHMIAGGLLLLSTVVILMQMQYSTLIVFALASQVVATVFLIKRNASKEASISEELEDFTSKFGEANATAQSRLSMLDSLFAHVMIADSDLNITFVNQSLQRMLKMHEAAIQAQLPKFNADTLVGTNIDVFHKNPNHQRQILSSMSSSHKAEIQIGTLHFALSILPVKNKGQQDMQFMVEWSDLTDRKQNERQQQENTRLKVSLDKANTQIMLADNDFNIIYVNDSLHKMMSDNTDVFKSLKSDFDADKLIGLSIDVFHKNPKHQRELLSTLTESYQAEVSLKHLTFRLIATPIIDDHGVRLGTSLEWADISAEKAMKITAQNNARIKAALDGVTTCVMMADANNNITYLNGSVLGMLKQAEQDIRKELPNFSVDKLIGGNIDQFHKKPEHQQMMLERLTSAFRTRIQVGKRQFTLIASPVFDDEQVRIGTVVEWEDITEQVETEKEVQSLVNSVSQGMLGALISTDNKEGFILAITEGLNLLSQTVNAFVKDISVNLERVSDGDLTVRVENDYEGMFGDVKDALNGTLDKLNEVIGQIQMGSDSIRSANHEIAAGNDQLSQRTETQASNLEETAASMEELTSTVKNTADNASQANTTASEAKTIASQGEAIVGETVESMNLIRESSNKISAIIGVIDEIAFQTNLLALNASVEAARAGEHGRGFSVVANEVRNLAQRSAMSAKEIKTLIDDSSEKVSTGSNLVNRCGDSLKEIIQSVDNLSALIGEIDSATSEQASGINQVNQAVTELDNITQQNAALAEEASSASRSSVDQIDDMMGVLSFFHTDSSSQSGKTALKASPPRKTEVPKKATSASNKELKTFVKGDDAKEDEWVEF